MLQGRRSTGIVPKVCDCLSNFGIKGGVWIWIDAVGREELDKVLDSGTRGFKVELFVGTDEGSGGFKEVFIHGRAIHGEFFNCVAILMDDLHLFDNRRFAAFSGACVRARLAEYNNAFSLRHPGRT